MRKQTKVAVVVSAAALLAMGASMTSFAKGWTLEDNEWVWLDSDGERVYDEWKKSVDGNYYYLDDEEGIMATNRLVGAGEKDTYYVKEDGTRVVNDWVAVDNEDGEEINGVEPEVLWYYFGANGKAVKPTDGSDMKKKTINGRTYFFNEDGQMLNGWVQYDGDYWYCGTEDEGWAYTGWQYLETETENCPAKGDDCEDEEWFYFKSGKMQTGTEYLDGHYYTFGDNGVMESGWTRDMKIASTATVAGGIEKVDSYIADNGVMGSGWVKAANEDGEDAKWYYMVTIRDSKENAYRAIPFNSGSDYYRAKTIDGKVYMFDTEGKMLTGKQDLTDPVKKPVAGDGAINPDYLYDGVSYKPMDQGIYYFEEDGAGEGKMVTGKVTINNDDVEETYYFAKGTGKAYTNTYKDNSIYNEKGIRVEAEDGNSYSKYTVKTTINDVEGNPVFAEGDVLAISASGKVKKSGTVKIDGDSYDVIFDEDTNDYRVELKKED